MTSTSATHHVVRGALPMMATACGITVANVYLCQPLLSAIAKSFDASSAATGWVATAAQVGYALGIFLVVPLADRADSGKMIRLLLAVACCALIAAGLSPSLHFLVFATFAVTVATVVPQVLIPLAVATASSDRSGRVVGTLQSGLILGILLSRTISGAIGQYAGSWRVSYYFAAFLTAILFFVLPRFLPKRHVSAGVAHVHYLSLLASLPKLLIKWPGLRLSALLGACIFGAFSAFWATLAFHVEQPPFGFGPAQAGLFGLWGAVGALIAPFCGRLSDRYGPTLLNAVGIFAVFMAFIAFFLGGSVSMFALVAGVNLLDFGNQAGQIANQARIFKLDPAARARLNTVYMVSTFGGAAIGSTAGAFAWEHQEWQGVCMTGFVLVAIAALLLLAWRLLGQKNSATA